MPDLPEILTPLAGLKEYHESIGSCVVFFVRRLGDDHLMYIGWTENLPRYVVHMRQKARLHGWRFTNVYYSEMPVKYAPAVAQALVRHFKPLMNTVPRHASYTERKILHELGLT